MVSHRILDEVLAAWSHVAILRVLQDIAQGLTGREIARQAGISHQACDRALARLENLHIIRRQRGGRSHFFALNRRHQLVAKALLPLLATERNFLPEFCTTVHKYAGKSTLSIILYGSVARKQETSESDIDLCFVVRHARDKTSAQAIAHEISPILLERFGAKLSPIFFTVAEFKRKARKREPPINSIAKEGIVISGISLRELTHG